MKRLLLLLFLGLPLAACSDDDDDLSEADRIGVGAACENDMGCVEEAMCLQQFKGGYCGLTGCTTDLDCPEASACVAHDDGENYCFRICTDKAQCNVNRPVDAESNCSSNINFVDPSGKNGIKACVPPSN